MVSQSSEQSVHTAGRLTGFYWELSDFHTTPPLELHRFEEQAYNSVAYNQESAINI